MQEDYSHQNSTLIHSWELASMTRRQRVMFAEKINIAFLEMQEGKSYRQFAVFNATTKCWLVFYFQYGGTNEEFHSQTIRMTQYKLCIEKIERGFNYSVLGYGFRKSTIKTPYSYDAAKLWIEDANSYSPSEQEYLDAKGYFGSLEKQKIKEFSNS